MAIWPAAKLTQKMISDLGKTGEIEKRGGELT